MDGILINLDDINLPTAGKAWKTMVAHVLYHIDHDELFSEINDDWIMEYIRDEGWPIQDLFDDDEVIDYILEAEIPPDVVYDEEAILDCECVKKHFANLVKRNLSEVLGECPLIKNQQEKIAELEKKNAELEEKLAVSNTALECLGIACEEAECCGGTKQWGRGRWPCEGCEDCDPA